MVPSDINELLTQIDKGTPAGDLLRCYWHPLALADDVNEINSIKKVTLLGENLILIQKREGGYALMGEKCPHRGASLCYAFMHKNSVRCPYHGWEFDFEGNCVSKPFESVTDERKLLASYPVIERCGLLFSYLGAPEKKPVFPEWDIFHRTDGSYKIEVQEDYDCNWLQVQENAADVTHTFFTHAKYLESIGLEDNTGFNLPMKKFGFQPFEWGMIKSWEYEDTNELKVGWGNLLIFPNILRLMTETHWRVPINNTTTRIFWLTFVPDPNIDNGGDPEITVYKQPPHKDAEGKYMMNNFMSQDAMVTETQGEIFDRSKEKLGASDRGIAMYRSMLLSAIKSVENGEHPFANEYDVQNDGKIIDLRQWMGGYIPMSCLDDPNFKQTMSYEKTFDEKHETFSIDSKSIDLLSRKYLTGLNYNNKKVSKLDKAEFSEIIFTSSAVSIWDNTKGPAFLYAASVPGPFYVNTEKVIGAEQADRLLAEISYIVSSIGSNAEKANALKKAVMAEFESNPVYQKIVETMIRDSFSRVEGAYDCISGGERRDWFFSIPIAAQLKKDHLYIFKDNSVYMDRSNENYTQSTQVAVHVADLVHNAASYFNNWLPALEKISLRLLASVCVINRGENGVKKLQSQGYPVYSLHSIDTEFFDELFTLGLINQKTSDEMSLYFTSKQRWCKSYLLDNIDLFGVPMLDKKSKDRLRNFVRSDPWSLSKDKSVEFQKLEDLLMM